MRTSLLALCCLLGTAPLAAQSIEVGADIGLRAPVGGKMVVPVPVPAQTGFRSVPHAFTETGGLTVGITARVPLRSAFALQTGVSTSLSNRVADAPDITPEREQSSRLTSVQLGLSARRALNTALRVDVGVGGELLHLGGDAYSTPLDVRASAKVVPDQRTVGAAVAFAGVRRALSHGGAVRLDVQLRRYEITSRWSDAAFAAIAGDVTSTPYTDLRVTVGWSR